MFVYIFSAATFGKYWDNFGTTLGPHWDFWTTLRQLLASSVIFETTLRQLWHHMWLLGGCWQSAPLGCGQHTTILYPIQAVFPCFQKTTLILSVKTVKLKLTKSYCVLLCVESISKDFPEKTLVFGNLFPFHATTIFFVKTMILIVEIGYRSLIVSFRISLMVVLACKNSESCWYILIWGEKVLHTILLGAAPT